MATNPYTEGRFNSGHAKIMPMYRSNSMDWIPLKRLTGVKIGQIYNPHLPSLRRIEMDHVLGKLPYEHCRATTWLSRDHFDNPAVKIFEDRQFNKQVYRGASAQPLTRAMSANKIGNPGKMQPSAANTPSRAQIARAEMEALAKSQETFSKYLTVNLNAKDTKTPAPLRYAQTLKEEPSVDWRGQMPVPARGLDKHRSYPNYHLDIASSAWK